MHMFDYITRSSSLVELECFSISNFGVQVLNLCNYVQGRAGSKTNQVGQCDCMQIMDAC